MFLEKCHETSVKLGEKLASAITVATDAGGRENAASLSRLDYAVANPRVL